MSAARKSARDQECALVLPGCMGNTGGNVVLCHLRMFGGGGMGKKPSDLEAVYGCSHCHDLIDGRSRLIHGISSAFLWEAIARALVRTHRIMRKEGILTIKGETR